MNSIQKNTKHGSHRVHAAVLLPEGCKPLCGGGNSARSAQWQETILEPDCKRCRAILARRQAKQQTQEMNNER